MISISTTQCSLLNKQGRREPEALRRRRTSRWSDEELRTCGQRADGGRWRARRGEEEHPAVHTTSLVGSGGRQRRRRWDWEPELPSGGGSGCSRLGGGRWIRVTVHWGGEVYIHHELTCWANTWSAVWVTCFVVLTANFGAPRAFTGQIHTPPRPISISGLCPVPPTGGNHSRPREFRGGSPRFPVPSGDFATLTLGYLWLSS
jgi:hypothetical protein